MLINKNDADLKQRIDQINQILAIHKPHFLSINELQKHKNDKITQFQFPGYSLEFDNLDRTDNWSRAGVLIKKNIEYKRRKDLESEGIASVWIQIGCTGTKHILLQTLYRQFRRQGKPGTNTQLSQQARWNTIIEKWKLANTEGREILTLGDLNMDSISWEKSWAEMPPYERSKQIFYKNLRENILNNGTYKINQEFTRQDIQPEGRKTCLDHLYTTNPEKISSFKTHHKSFSDHALLEMNRNGKKIKNTKKFIRICSMKNFDREKFKENLQNHPDYVEILYEKEML